MPENLFHRLLATDPDVLNPDFYQLLELDREDISRDQVESQYKSKMRTLQEVRSTKYKHFVEFLKGQLQTARRVLADEGTRRKYDKEILEDASAGLRQLIQTFVQISGDLTELEITEILARARQVNVPDRVANRLIDDELARFGFERVAPSVEQIERARKIIRVKQNVGAMSDTDVRDRHKRLRHLEEEARRSSGSDASATISDVAHARAAARSVDRPADVPDAARADGKGGEESDEVNLFKTTRFFEKARDESAASSAAISSGVHSSIAPGPVPRVVWTGKGDDARFVRVLPDGTHEKPIVFLCMPDSRVGSLLTAVTKSLCGRLGLEIYQTGSDRWEAVQVQLASCDAMIADFSGTDDHPEIPLPTVIMQATIAKHSHARPVLALTQAPPGRRLPGWQFVHYDAERLTDTTGESFPDRLKRALRRNLR